MDNLENPFTRPNRTLVMLAFLQADCKNPEYSNELQRLCDDLSLNRDINSNRPVIESLDDGYIETDGHQPSKPFLSDLQVSVEMQWPRNNEEVAALQEVAGMLRDIADQFEHNAVARATQNLCNNISRSPVTDWKHHLSSEVNRVLTQGAGLEHLPQERLFLALTLTLVKGVCEQAPRLLRHLFNTALQLINPEWTS
ncbi:BH3 interacting domain death agonist isoform X2 [Mugil cephalus]|nr:BH3 interacting domain death agonist isoform X2 [Mugil cephalus]